MVFNCGDGQWEEYIQRLPAEKQDIYWTDAYCHADEILEGGTAKLFVCEENDNLAVYPFIMRKIQNEKLGGDYYDIETPYGYGGPVIKSGDADFAAAFETAFLEYCEKEHIIAEFIRFHPMIKNEHIFKKDIEVLHNRITVCLNLEKSIDEIWMHDISTQNRNTIRKCQKNGLTVEISEDYDEFLEIYNETMQKVGASDFYFFNQTYYEQVKNNPAYVLMRVRQGQNTLAAAIFMKYKDYFHYHLSGSRREFLKLAPNNILLWEAIQYAKKNGCRRMHFGGGLTDSEEDPLFRFKKRFSSGSLDFYIGKRIHNPEIYRKLIDEWERIHKQKATLLLQYRE